MITERTDPHVDTTVRILDTLFREVPNTAVRLWDGQTWGAETPDVTLVLRHPGALREMLLPGTDLAMAEAYLYDDIDIEGNIESIYDLGDALNKKLGRLAKLGIARDLMKLPKGSAGDPGLKAQAMHGPVKLAGRRHTRERDREAVRYHYDVSNKFFALFLGERMVYTCAYFDSTEQSLENAQHDKLELLCRKMRLQPGQKLLDLGSGWGGLILYAAEHYGVDATGITLSVPQAEWANECIARGVSRTDAGRSWRITATCMTRRISTQLFRWGCSSMWARRCCRSISRGRCGC